MYLIQTKNKENTFVWKQQEENKTYSFFAPPEKLSKSTYAKVLEQQRNDHVWSFRWCFTAPVGWSRIKSVIMFGHPSGQLNPSSSQRGLIRLVSEPDVIGGKSPHPPKYSVVRGIWCQCNAAGMVVAFSSHARILGQCSTFIPCLFFFFKVEISLCTLISLFRPGSVHSGSVSWDNCDWVFPDELHVSSIPDRFPYYACTAA